MMQRLFSKLRKRSNPRVTLNAGNVDRQDLEARLKDAGVRGAVITQVSNPDNM